MNVNFNYNGNNNQNRQARNDRALMRKLKMPYTWQNDQKMKKVRQVMNSISNRNAQNWYNKLISYERISEIKRGLTKALGRRANNRDIDHVFSSYWNGGRNSYINNHRMLRPDANFDEFTNVDRNDVIGRLAKKFGRDTSKQELSRFKRTFFEQIDQGIAREMRRLKPILRNNPILLPAQFGNISGVNNLTGRSMPVRAIRNAAIHVFYNLDVTYNNNNNNSSANYVANTNRVRRNAIRNASNRTIAWQTKVVNTLPRDAVSLQNFKNGSKVVNIGYNKYVSPATFRALARTSMIQAYNRNGNAVLFKNPFTRTNLKRSNVKFVVLRTKNAAARKIQRAFRSRVKQVKRRKT